MVPLLLLACGSEPDIPEPETSPEPALAPAAAVEEPTVEPLPEPGPAFSTRVLSLPESLVEQMHGTSYREGCPTPLGDLRLVELNHYGFDGEIHAGRLVVHREAVDVMEQAFAAAFEHRFPLRSVRPVSEFGGSDARSMAADNTSAFNCRRVKGTSVWSEHSTGLAIDINPRENPWVKGGAVDPPEGKAFLERSASVPGLLTEDHPVTRVFLQAGWGWGGHWSRLRDYQHFSRSGR